MPFPEFLANVRKGFFPDHAARNPLEAVDQGRDRNGRGVVDQQVHMVVFAVELDQRCTEVPADGRKDRLQLMQNFSGKDIASIFCDKDQMNMHRKNAMPSLPEFG